jgi:DNA-binding NtrC family response regulator
VDVRVISATNKDLEEECANHAFRADLFFRLNVIPVHVPALRERREYIIPILKYFLGERIRADIAMAKEAEKMPVERDRDSNVRELGNIAERIALFLPGHDDLASSTKMSCGPCLGWPGKTAKALDKNSMALLYWKRLATRRRPRLKSSIWSII